MRKKSARRTRQSNTVGIAIFIGSLIGLLIFTALIIRLVLLIHRSTFDWKSQFVVAVKRNSSAEFVVFNPDDKSIKTLVVSGNIPNNLEIGLALPVDAIIRPDEDVVSITDITDALAFHRNKMHTSLTQIDAINLFIFSHMVDSKKIISETIFLKDIDANDQLLTKILTDNRIYKEGKSIAVINATDISGLGTTISKLLTHMGGNVVSVTTADKPSISSSIGYTGDPSYTVTRLSQVLHFPLVHLSGIAISDITVTLGTDKSSLFE